MNILRLAQLTQTCGFIRTLLKGKMILVRVMLFSAFIFMIPALTAAAGQNIITLNYPPDNTIMEFGPLSVSISVPQDAADTIKVSSNGEDVLQIIPVKGVACFSVPLSVGINRLSIAAVYKNRQTDEVVLTVFRRSELEIAYRNPPEGFKKDNFHMKDRSQCAACHILEPGEPDRKNLDISASPSAVSKENIEAAIATSTCYSCHKSMTSYPFVHVPAAVWSCLSCHGPAAEPKYSVMKPDTRVCFGCHIKQKEDWYARKYQHGPFTSGQCAICHNPHAADHPYNLHKSTWNLCLSCHIDKGSGEHIVASYINTYNHPTRGKPDPLRKGRELSCASCHEPHASYSPRLWRLDAGSGFALCKKCHAQ